MLQRLDENLWCRQQPLRAGGLELGARMSIVRTAAGELFVYSPIALDDQIRRDLDKLGRVRWIIAPSRFHHMWAGDWAAAYPEARLWIARGVAQKRPDLHDFDVLAPMRNAPWAGDLEHELVAGFPLVNEVVFFHPASRSLLVCDLLLYAGAETPWTTWLVLAALGLRSGYGTTWFEWLLLRDTAAARQSLERILTWDFDRVVITHGPVLETGGHAVLREAYSWLLRGS